MKNSNKKVLIVSYVFPPYPGVGGRRWAKFSKCLAKNGYDVHVISARNPFKQDSYYSEDVKSDKISVYTLPAKYPKFMSSGPENIFEKAAYKIMLLYLKLFTRGNYYDRAVLWEKQLLKQSLCLIKRHDICNVIITGAPFSLLYHSIKLLEKVDVNLFADIRDPWTWGTGYGINSISDKRKKYEESMEELVVKNFKSIFLPVEPMLLHMQNSYPEDTNKFILLPHAFDHEETTIEKPPVLNEAEGVYKLILYGTLYENLEKEIIYLARFLTENKNVQVMIYTEHFSYKDVFEKRGLLGSQVVYNKSVALGELFQRIRESDYVLMMHPYNPAANGVSTKFYEIVNLRTPILFVGDDEFIEDFLNKNSLGIYVNPDGNESIIKKMGNFKYNHAFDVNKCSFEQITNDVLIKSLEN